ncbi:Disease resistance protein RGA2 [Bienertia sinuspersici]
MADIATLLSVAQTLFAALQCSYELKKMCSIWGYKSKLQDLKNTISTINKVLIDAEEAMQELSNEAWEWILKLKDAVYDADDLFDEFLTLAELNKQHFKGAKFTKKAKKRGNLFICICI